MTDNNTAGEVIDSTIDNTINTPIKTSGFLDTLPEDLRNEPSLKDFKGVDTLAKSYIEANKLIGSRVALPTDKSTPEEINKFYSKLGRPDNQDGYKLPDGTQETDLLKSFKKVAFEKGLNNQQFNEIFNVYNQHEQGTLKSYEEQNKQFQETFNKEFGDKAETVKQNTQALIGKYATPEDIEVLNKLDASSTIALAKVFNKMSSQNLTEGNLKTGNQLNTGLSLQETINKMNEIKKSNTFYEDNKEYQQLASRKRDLYLNGDALYK